MKINIAYADSMTGEQYGVQIEMPEFSGEALLQTFKTNDGEENYSLEAWVPDVHGTTAAFVIKHTGAETYLDGFVIAGIAYIEK